MAAGTAVAGEAASSRRVARVLSLAFQPILTGVYLLVAVGLTSGAPASRALAWSLGLSLITAGMPALDLWVRLRRGHIGDFQMILREERLRPLLAALAWTGVAFALAWILGAPRPLTVTLAVGAVNGVILTLVTNWWKISFHTATLASAVLVLTWFWDPAALLLTPLVPALAWSRVRLHRHTLSQTVAGALAAAAVTLAILASVG